MDLKMSDVKKILNVSESTIRRWLAEGKIPAYRLGNQYRFSPTEIEAWVLKRRVGASSSHDAKGAIAEALSEEDDLAKPLGGAQQFSLFRSLHKGCVFNDIKGSTKEEVIINAVERLAKEIQLDGDLIADLLLQRERMMPTALNRGIAVPHTREILLQQSQDIVSAVFLEKPIPYGALDGQPVHTLFFLFSSNDKQHLHLLAKIAHLASLDEGQALFKQHPTKQQLLHFVKEWEAKLTHSL